jgi:hypothetical protein
MVNQIQAQYEKLQAESGNLYQFLNRFRDWVNQSLVNYEIFLEDNWSPGTTTIEYTFRSLDTFNELVFAKDEYHNSRDKKGIWHLGEYVSTRWMLENPWDHMAQFFVENGPPRYKPFEDSAGNQLSPTQEEE